MSVNFTNMGLALVVLMLVGCSDKTPTGDSNDTDTKNISPNTQMLSSTTANKSTNTAPKLEMPADNDLELETMMKQSEQAMSALETRLGTQEARLVARATANMSDTKMAELQTLRNNEVIMRSDGVLIPPYVQQEICEAEDICREIITNTQTRQTVYDGSWVLGYIQTGVGKEVVRKK